MHRSGLSTVTALLGALALGACVTINIYFPAAAAERAADRIIDEVWQLQPDAAKTKPDAAQPQSGKPAPPQSAPRIGSSTRSGR